MVPEFLLDIRNSTATFLGEGLVPSGLIFHGLLDDLEVVREVWDFWSISFLSTVGVGDR